MKVAGFPDPVVGFPDSPAEVDFRRNPTLYAFLATRVSGLRSVLGAGVSARIILEPLQCCPLHAPAEEMGAALQERGFDVAGVRELQNGSVVGFVSREPLKVGTVRDRMMPLNAGDLISDATALGDLLTVLSAKKRVFVLAGSEVKGIVTLTDRLLEPRPGSLRSKLDELRTFAVSRLTKIRELLAHPENVEKAHEAIAEQVGQLTLEASNEDGKRLYLAHGEVDFFGEGKMAHSVGAGGQNRTGYARLFRAALYQ